MTEGRSYRSQIGVRTKCVSTVWSGIISAQVRCRPHHPWGVFKWTLQRFLADTAVTDSHLLAACRSLQPKRRMERNFSPVRLFSKVLLTVLLTACAAFLEPFDLLYENAVQAFYNNDYDNVVRYMEGALSSHREVQSTRIRCRLRCQDQHQLGEIFSESRFFDAVIRRAACMNACVEKKLGSQSVHKVSEDVVQDFNRRIPYNYLQLAYQKVRGKGCAGDGLYTAGQQVNYACNKTKVSSSLQTLLGVE